MTPIADSPLGRRGFLKGAAISGASALAVGAVGGSLLGVLATPAQADPPPTAAAPAADVDTEPVYGAGVFDVDPDQTGVSQDPTVAVTGIAVMPEDWEF
jgi:hypothetical protein